MGSEIRIERLTGEAIRRHLPAIARLRILVFREWPYLYDGDEDYERRYLERYVTEPRAVVVGAFDGDELVGASTALPLSAEPPELTEPVARAGLPVEKTFYFGESVLLRPYRGRGIGVRFFLEREDHARSFGEYEYACFCGVIRDPNDPRKPADYVPLDAFWRKRGYTMLEGAVGTIPWKEIGEAEETPKRLQFWYKKL
ncbi:MAG: GNAT family N-acetyltransferase [Geminicoccaceae bacterium]|nr:GNAT family N-acetyltransferase [Geminicoccaceae bacterium]MDW8125275.1 GNAT family N-acetyltransferase [Geminicoccaceae bacterium]MDW8340473.1 GNAT family N-acetyltransferase [Geminicoccaceae bacterium]